MLPRKILKTEKQSLIDHFLNDMVGELRRLRFGYPAQDEAVIKYIVDSVEKIDGVRNQWFVVAVGDRIIGTCHVGFIDDAHVELGFTVSQDYQGHGIGQKLFQRGSDWARSRGAEAICMQCLSENSIVQHIANKNGMKTITVGPGEKESTRKLTQPKYQAIQSEVAHDVMSIYDAIIRKNSKMFEDLLNVWIPTNN